MELPIQSSFVGFARRSLTYRMTRRWVGGWYRLRYGKPNQYLQRHIMRIAAIRYNTIHSNMKSKIKESRHRRRQGKTD